MKIDRNNLQTDLHFILSIDHHGYCTNEGSEYSCDHEYNRCYRISGIEVTRPSAQDFSYLAEALVPECKTDSALKLKVLQVCQSLADQFDLTDTSNYDWEAEGDYYGDHLSYVRFVSTLQEYLATELEKI
jgi:hypothetical protein